MTSLCLNIAFKSDISQQARFSIIIKNNSIFYYPLYFDLYYLHFTFMTVTHDTWARRLIHFSGLAELLFQFGTRPVHFSHRGLFLNKTRPPNVLHCLSRAGLYCFSVNVSSSAGTGAEQLIMS